MSVPDGLGSGRADVDASLTGAFFIGTYHNKLDDKGRVSVPAAFRTSLVRSQSPSEVTLLPQTQTGWLEMFPTPLFLRLLDNMQEQADDSSYAIEAVAMHAQQLAIDGNGRIILARDLIMRFGLDENESVVFAGYSYRFALMSQKRYQRFQDESAPLPTFSSKQIKRVVSRG